MNSHINKKYFAFFVALVFQACFQSVHADSAKNIILMIADGQGFNTVTATDYYTGSPAVYEDFPVKFGMTTYSASNNFSLNPLGYDPSRMWGELGYPHSNTTDSAADASAMYTGVKVFNEEINWSPAGALTTFFEGVSNYGRSTGAVTSVQLSHATPAAVAAHNPSRGNYSDIAIEMIYKSPLDVIMGAAHPEYDNNGQTAPMTGKYVGGSATWTDLTDGNGANGFSFIETKSQFEDLAHGATPYDKVIGVAQVNGTLQYKRDTGAPMNSNVPTLTTMTEAALNVLDENPDGFALMVEGGAVDWANHGNDLERMIEEEIDFNNSVEAVVNWVQTNSNWDETLLIVTADHETGHLWGPDGEFSSLVDNGEGEFPDAMYYSGDHTNALVPLYAQGAGSDLFADLVDGIDAAMVDYYGLDGNEYDGSYIDNTDVFTVMNIAAAPVPLPASVWLFGSALGLLGWMRRKKT